MLVDLDRIRAARERIAGQVLITPLTRSVTLGRLTGARLHLKFENLQFTSSFKERGALNRLLLLTPEQRQKGVIAMSAGNHAQALAHHGSRLGVPTCIVMPRLTPNNKVEQTRIFGAEVILHGESFEETRAFTESLAHERGMTLIHPFDDPDLIAGQGTLGLEIVEQLPELECVVVPVGGGGLAAGVATAVKALRPEVKVVGAQVERYAAAYCAFTGETPKSQPPLTIAEGIAVETPGTITLPILLDRVDEMLTVNEQQVEHAVFELLEIEKSVVEGAGAVGLAAVHANPERFRDLETVVILSGGNIDMMILSSVVQRGLVRTDRLVRLEVEIPDLPGALAQLAGRLRDLDSNIVEIDHRRAFGGSSVRSTVVELCLQMRGESQLDQVVAGLEADGYEVRRLG